MSQPTISRPEPQVPPATRRSASSHFNRTIINFWLDCTLLLVFLVLCFVSAVLQFLFPPGAQAAEGVLWGGDVVAWRNLQFATLCLLAFGILLHLMLHWSWICGVISTRLMGRKPSKDTGSQTLLGVGTLIVVLHILAISLLAAWWSMAR